MFKVSRTRFMYYTTQRSLPSKYRPSRVLQVDKTDSPISYYSYLREFAVLRRRLPLFSSKIAAISWNASLVSKANKMQISRTWGN